MKILKKLIGSTPEGETPKTAMLTMRTLILIGDKLFAKHIDDWQQDMRKAEIARSKNKPKTSAL